MRVFKSYGYLVDGFNILAFNGYIYAKNAYILGLIVHEYT